MINEEAINLIEEFMVIDDWSLVYLPDLPDALELAIKALKKQHGEWRTTPNPNHSPFDGTSAVVYICSQCAYSNGDRIAATWNFCPNCGTDMRAKKSPCDTCETDYKKEGCCCKEFAEYKGWLEKEGEENG